MFINTTIKGQHFFLWRIAICDQTFLIYLCRKRAIKTTLRPQGHVVLVNRDAAVKHFEWLMGFMAANVQHYCSLGCFGSASHRLCNIMAPLIDHQAELSV